MAITDRPTDECPRGKLLAKGADALSDADATVRLGSLLVE